MSSNPVLATIAFLALGIIAAWLGKKWFGLDNSGLYASLFFAPILVYLVVSGQLKEFKGFGVEATFREIASQKIDLSSRIQGSIAGQKHGMAQALFGGGSDVAVLSTATVIKSGDANRPKLAFEVAEQIAASIAQGTFELLVIVDDNNHVLGYFPRHWFLDLTSMPDVHSSRGNDPSFDQTDTARIERNLRKTYLWDILVDPNGRATTWGKTRVLSTDATYLDAYRALTQESVMAIPVVDGSAKYAGIIRLRDVESKMLGALLPSSEKPISESNKPAQPTPQ
ncbi:MAG: CBS domain-containing protein [Burkholderiales bacterium]|jgi:hypothetical protein|nr:CBS domain-containing protein [Gallionella sp.]